MLASKWLQNIIIVLILLVLTGIFLPGDYHVERSVDIKAPPGKVYALIVDLRKWEQWSVWYQLDPNAVLSYDGPDRAIGMEVKWRSEVIGNGEIELSSLQFNRQIIYSFRSESQRLKSDGEFRLEPLETGTKLIWISNGDVGLNIFARYKLLLFTEQLASDLEVGLENIKTMAENGVE